MIQSMGGFTFLGAFDIVVSTKNSLIQARKLPPRPPMPYFVEVQPLVLVMVPLLAIAQPTLALPTFNVQVATKEYAATAPIRELKEKNVELKEKSDSMMRKLHNYGNEIMNFKRQQG